jgi:hypothetical protein
MDLAHLAEVADKGGSQPATGPVATGLRVVSLSVVSQPATGLVATGLPVPGPVAAGLRVVSLSVVS